MSVREPRSRYLAPTEAKRFYDRLGSGQDWRLLQRSGCFLRSFGVSLDDSGVSSTLTVSAHSPLSS